MARKKTNEEIIAALLSCGTVKGAAEMCGISPRTIFSRMAESEFQALFLDARNDVLRKATLEINAKLAEAVNTVASILSDTSVPAAVRLQAAKIIIDGAAKLSDRLTAEEAKAQEAHNPKNPWDAFI